MKNTLLLILLTFVFAGKTLAQQSAVQWNKTCITDNSTFVNGQCTDAEGNTYQVLFSSNLGIDVCGSTLPFTDTQAFIAKFDKNGTIQWTKNFTGGNYGIYNIKNDASGNIYLSGFFGIDLNLGTTILSGNGNFDAFLIKMNSDGDVVWASSWGGTGTESSNNFDFAPNGDIVVECTIQTDPFTLVGENIQTTAAGIYNTFLVRLNAGGTPIWAKSLSSTFDMFNSSLFVTDGNEIVFSGLLSGNSLTINGQVFTGSADYDFYLFKLDENGNYTWGGLFGGDQYDRASDIQLDRDGNVYLMGQFYSASLQLGSTTLNNSQAGNADVFVAKLDPNGNVIWANSYGEGLNNENSYGSTLDAMGNLYFSFVYASPSVSINGQLLPFSGTLASSLLKLSNAGQVTVVKSFTATDVFRLENMNTDSLGNLYVSAYYHSDAITIDGIDWPQNAENLWSLFKISPCYGTVIGNVTVNNTTPTLTLGDTISVRLLRKSFYDQNIWNLAQTYNIHLPNDTAHFLFDSLPPGLYSIVVNNTDTEGQSVFLPTFGGNTHLWANADLYPINPCDTNMMSIDLIVSQLTQGENEINGMIYFNDFLFQKTETNSDPIPLIDIVVEKDSVPYLRTKPEPINGFPDYWTYDFQNLPMGNYNIILSIPGIPQNTIASVSLNNTTSSFEADFCVDTILIGTIDVCNFDTIPGSPNALVETATLNNQIAFPNPANEEITLLNPESFVRFELIGLSGNIILRGDISKPTISLTNLPSGFYQLKLIGTKRTTFKPLVKL